MKKKWWIIGGVSAAVLVMAGTAFAGTNGYEAYKDALIRMSQVNSAQAEIRFKIADNGEQLIRGSGSVKMDHQDRRSSGTMNLETPMGVKDIEFFGDEDRRVYREAGSEEYRVHEGCEGRFGDRRDRMQDPAQLENMERLTDILLTGISNQVESESDGNGGQVVTLDLESGEVPETVNLMMAMRHGREGMGHGSGCDDAACAEFMPEIPELVTDFSIEKLYLQAHLNAEGDIVSQELTMVVHGTDAAGKAHERVIEAELQLSGIDATTPDAVDLEGKTVIQGE